MVGYRSDVLYGRLLILNGKLRCGKMLIKEKMGGCAVLFCTHCQGLGNSNIFLTLGGRARDSNDFLRPVWLPEGA